MPVVHCDSVARSCDLADLAVGVGAGTVKTRFAVLGRADLGWATLGLRGFLAGFMASFMALAPVRSANRAMALNER
jgi:hypothetical protein